MTKNKTLFTVLVAIAVIGAVTTAGATGINLDAGMKPATDTICATINAIQKSVLLQMVALVMFFAGGIMMWLKMRGGMPLAITGFIGFFLVKQLLAVAIGLKLAPATCKVT